MIDSAKQQQFFQKLFEDRMTQTLDCTGHCHECNTRMEFSLRCEDDGTLVVPEGMGLYAHEDKMFVKCPTCFEQDQRLHNFQPCEKYSRVVGYIRPVKQWNKGKQEEFAIRTTFNIHDEIMDPNELNEATC